MNYIDMAWYNFQSTGKIEDYLSYKQVTKNDDITLNPKDKIYYADKNKGYCSEPAEYR